MVIKQNFRTEAKILPISYLHLGDYIVGNETANSYLKLIDGSELIRINCVAAVVRREDLGTITILTIDDGSDNVSVRIFDKKESINDINVGQVVLIIGRIREYNKERYIAAEIIKIVSPRWLKYRSLILKFSHQKIDPKIKENEKVKFEEDNSSFKKIKKIIESEHEDKNNQNKELKLEQESKIIEEKEEINPYLELINLISKLDSGEGVALEIIINESEFSNTEELLQKMMENGDIFQNMPGKVKVL